MRIEYKHKKTRDEPYKIIDGFLSKLQEQYNDIVQDYSKKWNDSKDIMEFSVSVRGFNTSGNMQLYDKLVVIEVDLPFLVGFYQNQLESMIKQKLKELFQ